MKGNVMMFSYDDIQKFNETEVRLYKSIVDNGDKLPYMTIRELAEKTNMSTSSILRFCHKMNYDGYNEFKKGLTKYLFQIQERPPQNDLSELLHYFHRTNTNSSEQKLEQGTEFIRKAERVIFVGQGSSGTLARYGARFFSNLGKFSIGLEDPYYPITKDMLRTNGGYNATTQVPVLFLIETLARRL